MQPVRLEELLDPETGRIRTRLVDVTTEAYRVARDNMVRLEPEDFEGATLERLAAQTNLTPAEFARAFAPVARL